MKNKYIFGTILLTVPRKSNIITIVNASTLMMKVLKGGHNNERN